jgi:hypothetical protein
MKKYSILFFTFFMLYGAEFTAKGCSGTIQATTMRQIAYGICPAGAEKVGAVLAAGLCALPFFALESHLNSTYSDISPSFSQGLAGTAVVAGLYGAYKTYNKLYACTQHALLDQKNMLLKVLSDLQIAQNTPETIARDVQLIFSDTNSHTWLVESHLYIKDLLESLATLDLKCTALNKPFLTPVQYTQYEEKLKHTLLHIQSHTLFKSQQRDYIQNKLSTKAIRLAWWTTKNTAKGALKVSWFATKTLIKTAARLSLLMLKNTINSIIV